MLLQSVEDDTEGLKMALMISSFHDQVVNIVFNVFVHKVAKDNSHRPMIGCSSILNLKGMTL